MALYGSLGFARWIMTAGRLTSGAVALSGLVTFLMLFGLASSPFSLEVPVLDRFADIGVLSVYTIGAAALLLPRPEPRSPAAMANGSMAGLRFRPAKCTVPEGSGHHA